MSSACWHTRKETSLGNGASRNSQAGLRPQYALARPWYSAESNKLPPTGGQAAAQDLCAYFSLGLCWGGIYDEDPILLSASPNAGAHPVEEAAFKARRMRGQMHRWNKVPQKKMEGLSAAVDMRRIVFIGNNWRII
jgi:hypothetical protein